MRLFLGKAIVVAVVTVMSYNAAHAQNSTLLKFDPSLYLTNNILPISDHILISRADYSGPFTSVVDLRFSPTDAHIIYSIHGNRSVSFIGDTIAIKMKVTEFSMDNGNGPESFTANPVFSYSYIVRMDGKVLIRSFTPGDELLNAIGENSAKLLQMLENACVGADAIKKDVGSLVWGDVAQDGDLGALLLNESWVSKKQLCGADLSKVHYFAKGAVSGVIVGRASISTLDARQGCSIDLEAFKIIDSRNGQVLYNSIKLDGKVGDGVVVVESRDQFESWKGLMAPDSQVVSQTKPVEQQNLTQKSDATTGHDGADYQRDRGDNSSVDINDNDIKLNISTKMRSPEPSFVKPVAVRMPAPAYPKVALHEHIEGVVTVKFTVGKDGHVSAVSVAISSGSGILDRAAVNEAKNWIFKPARRNGVLVSRTLKAPITFSLNQH